MVDLFRYIEHEFAVPVATDAIDVTNQSEFQTALNNAARVGRGPGPRAPPSRSGHWLRSSSRPTSSRPPTTRPPSALHWMPSLER